MRTLAEDGIGRGGGLGHGLPAVVHAGSDRSVRSLAGRIASDEAALRARLLDAGALLFRGFDVRGPADFARVVAAFRGAAPARSYVGGDSPRTEVADHVYTSTEAPPSVRIPLHNEMSYLDRYPRHVLFHCERPASRGGETPLADARRVFRAIRPAVRDRFVEKQITYRWSYRGRSPVFEAIDRVRKVSKSWMEVFDTDRPEVAERRCRELGMRFRWTRSGRLVVTAVRPAVRAHPDTRETVWFNQAHLFRFSPRWMGRTHYALASLLFFGPDRRTHDARYGDGRPIEAAALDHVHDVLERETVVVPWELGDVLVVDNLLCMHGRNPFRGPRRTLVALTA